MSGGSNSNTRHASRSGSRRHHFHRHSSASAARRPSTAGRRQSVRTPAGNDAAAAAMAREESRQREQGEEGGQHPILAGDRPDLRLKSYRARELSEEVSINTREAPVRIGTLLNDMQRILLETPLPADISTKPLNVVKEWLNYWVTIFDEVFFFGSIIRQNLTGGFSLYRKSGTRQGAKYFRQTKNIRVNIWNPDPQHPEILAQHLLSAVLHCMLTAWFDLLGCECRHCARDRPAQRGGVGEGGHGPAFMDALAPIQRELQKVVPWTVDCNIQ